MSSLSLQAAMAFEHAALEEVQQSLQAHLALEQAAMVRIQETWAAAQAEAQAEAAAGVDPSMVAPDAAIAANLAQAHAEAAAAGMDLDSYAAMLAEAEAVECATQEAESAQQLDAQSLIAHALAEQEAAAAGMDLATYVEVLAEAEAAEIARLQAAGGDEQALLEALAYQEGLALHQAELLAHQVALAGPSTPHELALLQEQALAQQQLVAQQLVAHQQAQQLAQLQILQLARQQALGLLG